MRYVVFDVCCALPVPPRGEWVIGGAARPTYRMYADIGGGGGPIYKHDARIAKKSKLLL